MPRCSKQLTGEERAEARAMAKAAIRNPARVREIAQQFGVSVSYILTLRDGGNSPHDHDILTGHHTAENYTAPYKAPAYRPPHTVPGITMSMTMSGNARVAKLRRV